VRLFPRTAVLPAPTRPPRRSRVALGVGGVVLGCVAVSSAPSGVRADPLTDKKHDIERHIDRAHEDLDESSDRLRSATAAWLKARADLVEARAHLSRTRGELAVARALDRRMQQRLDAAVARLRDARKELADGRADVVAARLIPMPEDSGKALFSHALYHTDPVLVQRKGRPSAAARQLPHPVDTVLKPGPAEPGPKPIPVM